MSAPRQAVVLSGGGANGAYEVGVLKALLSGQSPATGLQPLVPEIFAGTSIGSYNAAFVVAQWDAHGSTAAGNLEIAWLDKLAEVAGHYGNGAFRLRGDPFDLLSPSGYLPNPLRPFRQLAEDGAFLAWDGLQRAVQFATSKQDLRARIAQLPDFTAVVSTEPWKRTIRETIDFAAIRSSSRKLRIVATNWTRGVLRIFENLDMTDRMGPIAIEASSAIPGVFPVVLVGAEPHVDGGVLMNTPLKLGTEAGADTLHVIYLDPDVRLIPLDAMQSTIGTIYRQQMISWANVVNDDIGDAATINAGLTVLNRLDKEKEEEVTDPELAMLVKSLQKIGLRIKRLLKYQPLTIHRYHPRDDLSGGVLGLLNLERRHVEELIQRGFSDAILHDCAASGCVLPGVATPTVTVSGPTIPEQHWPAGRGAGLVPGKS